MARILLLLDHPGNRRLLGEWLQQSHHVVSDTSPTLHEPFDLAILDGRVLEARGRAVQDRKQAEGAVFFPVLLLVPRQQAGMALRYLGQTVDELLLTPIDRVELRARLDILLRVRQQSLELKRHNDALEALLEERRALERMKDEFISMASHELRTPLTSMKGYVSLLLDGEVGDLTADQQGFLDIVKTNTDRLINLVNDLLDISRLEAGRMQLSLREVDLDPVIRRVCTDLRPMREGKHIQTEVQQPPEPMRVQADADCLVQILINLLSNAYKYSPPNTSVTIRVQPHGETVQVDVVDQGMGISESDQQQLFSRFFRTNAAKRSGAGGTGLGLSITRSLVEMHGGTIWVTSQPGAGSTFSFTLPLAAKEAKAS